MNEIFDPRFSADAPSELALDAYVHGEAEPDEVEAVERWIQADPANAAVIEARRSGFEALPEANPQAMLARIRLGLEAAEAEQQAEARATQPEPTRPRFSFMQWLVGALTLAGVAAAAVVFAGYYEDHRREQSVREWKRDLTNQRDTVLTKGSLKLEVFRARGEQVSSMLPGDEATEGDRLRFKADNVPQGPGHLMVVGVESSGAVFPYYPADGQSVAAHGVVKADGALPGSAVLDDSLGEEQVWLVWCPRNFALGDLKPSNGELRTREACRVDGLTFEKK